MLPQQSIPFRCIHCDYDLRGLAGESVRCPECGKDTSAALYSSSIERKATNAAHAALNTALFLLPMCIFAAPLSLPRFGACMAIPFAFFALGWVREVWVAMRFVRTQTGAWMNLIVTTAACIACPVDCWVVISLLLRLGETLPGSGPFRVPVTVVITLLGVLFSLFAAYYFILLVAYWPTGAFARFKQRNYTSLLCEDHSRS